MKLTDRELIDLLETENNMRIYLQRYDAEPQKIDFRIWHIHVSMPKKKQMPSINVFIDKIITKRAILSSYLPKQMIRAKVYRSLNIPFSLNPLTDVVNVDGKKSNSVVVQKFRKFYNKYPETVSKNEKSNDVYEFSVERPRLLGSFTHFRERQRAQKAARKSAESAEQLDLNQNSFIQPDNEISRLKLNKKAEGECRTRQIPLAVSHRKSLNRSDSRNILPSSNQKSSNLSGRKTTITVSNQESRNQFDDCISELGPSKETKNKGVTISCPVDVCATPVVPAIVSAVDNNEQSNSIAVGGSKKQNCTIPKKMLSDVEKICRVFSRTVASSEISADNIISVAEDETDGAPRHDAGRLIESTAFEEPAPKHLTIDVIAQADEVNAIATVEKETGYSLYREADYKDCEFLIARLFSEEEVPSPLPSSCEPNGKPKVKSTSTIPLHPPLNMSITRTPRGLERPLNDIETLKSVLEDSIQCSNAEEVSSEIERLMQDVSALRTAAQKDLNVCDLAAGQTEIEFHPASLENNSKTKSQLSHDLGMSKILQSSAVPDLGMSKILELSAVPEVPEVCSVAINQLAPPSRLVAWDASDELNSPLVHDDDFPTEKPLNNVHDYPSPAANQNSDSLVVLPTPESECYVISDSQPSQNHKSATVASPRPLELEIRSLLQSKTARPDKPRKSNHRVETRKRVKLQSNTCRSFSSDVDEESVFRSNESSFSKASKTSSLVKSVKKATKPADKGKNPANATKTKAKETKAKLKFEKNVKKLTDFVGHKIVKRIASVPKTSIGEKTPSELSLNKRRKLYTSTDDEVVRTINKRRHTSKAKTIETASSEVDSTLGHKSDTSQGSYRNLEPKPFLSVSEKMELLSLRTSSGSIRSSFTPPKRQSITASPALFYTTDEKKTPRMAASTSKSSETPPNLSAQNASLWNSASLSVNRTPIQIGPSLKSVSGRTKSKDSDDDDRSWSCSFSQIGFSRKTMNYINESVKACLHLPNNLDQIPARYSSAFTSEKESDVSPQHTQKHKRMRTLKQRNVNLNYRLCLNSDSSSDDCSDQPQSQSPKRNSSQTRGSLKLYVPTELQENKRSHDSTLLLCPVSSNSSDTNEQDKTDIGDLMIPPVLSQNTKTPVPTQVLEESIRASLSVNDTSHRELIDGNVKSPRTRIGFFTDDEYESEELTVYLNDNLGRTQLPRTMEASGIVTDNDEHSRVSFDYGDEIRQLMSEVDSLQKGHQDVEPPDQNAINSAASDLHNSVASVGGSYQEIMWNSYPDSLETALTTAEEKLQDTRENLRRTWESHKDAHLVYNPIAGRESSQGSGNDYMNLSDLSN